MANPKKLSEMMNALATGNVSEAGRAFVDAFFPMEDIHNIHRTTYHYDKDDAAALVAMTETFTKEAAAMKKKPKPVLCEAAATLLKRLDNGDEDCANHILDKCAETILLGCKGMSVYGNSAFSPDILTIGREDDIDPFYINDETPHLIVKSISGVETRTESQAQFEPMLTEVMFQAVYAEWARRLALRGEFQLYEHGGVEPSHPSRYDWTWAGVSNAIALTSNPVIHGALDLAPHLPHSWPKPLEPKKHGPTSYLGEFAGRKNVNAFVVNTVSSDGPTIGDTFYDTETSAMKMYIGGGSWIPVTEAAENEVIASVGIGGAGLSGDLAAPSELGQMMARFNWENCDHTIVLKRVSPKKYAGFIDQFYAPIHEAQIEQSYGGGTYDITVRGPHPKTGLSTFLDGCRVKIAGGPKAIKPDIPVSLNGNPVKALPKNYTYTEDASHKETMEALAAQLDGKRRGKLNDPLQQALDKRRGLRPTRVDFVIAASEGIVARRDDGEPVTLKPTTPSGLAIDIDDDEPVDF